MYCLFSSSVISSLDLDISCFRCWLPSWPLSLFFFSASLLLESLDLLFFFSEAFSEDTLPCLSLSALSVDPFALSFKTTDEDLELTEFFEPWSLVLSLDLPTTEALESRECFLLLPIILFLDSERSCFLSVLFPSIEDLEEEVLSAFSFSLFLIDPWSVLEGISFEEEASLMEEHFDESFPGDFSSFLEAEVLLFPEALLSLLSLFSEEDALWAASLSTSMASTLDERLLFSSFKEDNAHGSCLIEAEVVGVLLLEEGTECDFWTKGTFLLTSAKRFSDPFADRGSLFEEASGLLLLLTTLLPSTLLLSAKDGAKEVEKLRAGAERGVLDTPSFLEATLAGSEIFRESPGFVEEFEEEWLLMPSSLEGVLESVVPSRLEAASLLRITVVFDDEDDEEVAPEEAVFNCSVFDERGSFPSYFSLMCSSLLESWSNIDDFMRVLTISEGSLREEPVSPWDPVPWLTCDFFLMLYLL